MNKTIIAIALSSTIALAACGKSGDSEMSAPASSAAPVSEKSATGIVEKTAEVSKETWEKTKDATSDAANTVATKSQEVYEDTKEAVSEAGTVVKDKAVEMGTAISDTTSDAYNSAKETTGEVIDATKEKGETMLNSMSKE
ncbi:MAG: hypothetical protein KZQ85_15635 [Candidatus Thiodiazotropha sp. (ex Myrtea sp. 'scaly one' KF741663)]|nr:hypothetical protein [Candidatus Thiodiazotropha sp. (ex Myrtea sp. 'scaly one' KF741663)]